MLYPEGTLNPGSSYHKCSNNAGDDPFNDVFEVYISNNDGANWVPVETVGPIDQASGGWYEHSFYITQFVTPTNRVKMRFDASDLSSGSIVEAGLDAFLVSTFNCIEPPTYICGDVNGSITVNILDVTYLISFLYKGGPMPDPYAAGDVNGSGTINILDVTFLISFLYKGGPPPEC